MLDSEHIDQIHFSHTPTLTSDLSRHFSLVVFAIIISTNKFRPGRKALFSMFKNIQNIYWLIFELCPIRRGYGTIRTV